MTASIEAVAELIRTQRMRIEVTPTVAYWAKAACLLTQLHEAIAVGTERVGHTVPGSRPPIAVEAADLWYEISYNTHAWAAHMSLNRRDPHPQSHTPWIGRLLRSCAAQAISTGRQPVADAIERNARRWASQITAMLTGTTTQRGIRGATCPNCHESAILDDRPGDGVYRVPAIILVTKETLRWLVCQACGWNDPITGPDQVIHATRSVVDGANAAAV